MKGLRVAARVSVLAAMLTVGSLVAVQYEAIVVRYLSLRHQVEDSRAEFQALEAKLHKQNNDVRRLSDPRGAIPEIHERLKEFGPNEEMIYIKGAPSPAPEAGGADR